MTGDFVEPALIDQLERRLRAALPGWSAQRRMSPMPRVELDSSMTLADLRPAAALVLLYEDEGAWCLPLTVRGARLRQHGGQVSLPGGRLDPGETAEQAAIREAQEEIGLTPSDVRVLGRLSPLPIPISGHLLQPIVGYTRRRPPFVPAEHEVERIIEVPVARLRAADAIGRETRARSIPPFGPMEVPFFDVAGARIWGATAMVLAEFLVVIEEAPSSLPSRA